MAEVILLSDAILDVPLGNTRYMAPYVLASQLREKGIDAIVIDYFTRIPDLFKYIEPFLSASTLAVGFSSTFLMPRHKGYRNLGQRANRTDMYHSGELWMDSPELLTEWMTKFRELLKRKSPRAQTVLGGTKAVNALYSPEIYSVFDYIAVGPSDLSFVDFVLDLKLGGEPRHALRDSVKVLENNQSVTSKICPTTKWTKHFGVQRGEGLPIEVARGCIFNCKFCHYDKKASTRKDLSILRDEFVRNYEEFGVSNYAFCDDCFNDSRQKVEDICGMIMDLPFKIEWISYARVDVSVRFPHTAELMVESGARGLYFGLESFNPVVARNAGKGTPTDKVKDFLIDFSKKYRERCFVHGSFIVGLPGETVESQYETADWILKNPVLDFLSVGPLIVAPYNPILDQAVVDYADYSRNPEKWGFTKVTFNPRTWEHGTMNSTQAAEIADDIALKWREDGHDSPIQNIWQYPHLRGLGFSFSEIEQMFRREENGDFWFAEVSKRFHSRLVKYWTDVRIVNAPIIPPRPRPRTTTRFEIEI